MTASSPPSTDEQTVRDESEPSTTRLSVTQIVASALAAVSTTVFLSYFGIAGTIIGAGVASVLTVVANYLYTRSIERTHAQLKPVVQKVRPGAARASMSDAGGAVSADRSAAADIVSDTGTTLTAQAPGPAGETAETTADAEPGTDAAASTAPRSWWLRQIDRHGKVRVLAASVGVVFIAVMGVVLAVELTLGKPLSDAVHGQNGSGTSISRSVGTEDDRSSGTSDGGTERTGDAPTGSNTPQDDQDETTQSDTSTSDDSGAENDTETDTGTGTDEESGTTPTPSPEPTDPEESGSTGESGSSEGSGGSKDGSGASSSGGTTDSGTGTDTSTDRSTSTGTVGSTSDGAADSEGSTSTD